MIDKKLWGSKLISLEFSSENQDTDRNALERQCRIAREIQFRLQSQKGVLLADDAGLGKTWTAALVALNIAQNNGSVLILVPNKGLLTKWESEFGKVVKTMPKLAKARVRIQRKSRESGKWTVGRVTEGTIVIATHTSYGDDCFPDHNADLLIVDEAHRSKNDTGVFKSKLLGHSGNFHGFLFLTATPFSISIRELCSLLDFISGAACAIRSDALKAFSKFANNVSSMGDGDITSVGQAEEIWRAAIAQLERWVLRYTIDTLGTEEKKSFGKRALWDIEVPAADQQTIEILARTDRLLNLKGSPVGVRGSDPRFHVGWNYLSMLMSEQPDEDWPSTLRTRNAELAAFIEDSSPLARYHATRIKKFLNFAEHPKISSVADAVAIRVAQHEKVVVFCRHHTIARELHNALVARPTLTKKDVYMKKGSAAFKTWREAWAKILSKEVIGDPDLLNAAMHFIEGSAFRTQVGQWLSMSVDRKDKNALVSAFSKTRVRGFSTRAKGVPTIRDAVLTLAKRETHDTGSESTLRIPLILGKTSWTPTMMSESDDLDTELALFNTPFGPDVLVATDKLSEGMDLHHCCRLLIHYELDPSPVRMRQREGRIRRIGSWAAKIGKVVEYAYPIFEGTRDEALGRIVQARLDSFDLLLGGAPEVENLDVGIAVQTSASLLAQLAKRLDGEIQSCLKKNYRIGQ